MKSQLSASAKQAGLGIGQGHPTTYAQGRVNVEGVGLCTLLALVVFWRCRYKVAVGLDRSLLLSRHIGGQAVLYELRLGT